MRIFRHDPGTTLLSRSFGGVQEWTTRAPMLALSTPDPALLYPAGTTLQPKVFIRNASGKTFTAHIRFDWRSTTASGKSATLDLPFKPNETQVLDVAALQAQKLLPADANWAAVILSAPVQPDELLAVAASYDQTGRYGAQTPFSDQLASHWEGGKWEVDGTHDSLVTIANGGDTTAQAQLTILYNQGAGQYQLEQTLAPDEQMALDFGKLIHDQVPDKNGKFLPPGLTSGAYRVRDLTDAPLGNLYEGKVILDKTYGHVTYGCMVCCGPDSPWMQYDPLDLLLDGFSYQAVQAVNSCSNRLVTITSDFPTWWTDNSSIATTSGDQINGVGVGSTNHYAQSVLMYWGPKEDSGGGDCPLSQEVPSSPTNVTPSVTFSDIPYVVVGQTATTTATVNPSNNSTPISLSITGPASVVSPTGTFTANTSVVVRGLTAGTATLSATVTNSDGSKPTVGSTSFPVVVTPPDHLIVVVDQQGVPASCPATGIQLRQMQMRVVDVNGNTVPNSPAVAEAIDPLPVANSCNNGSPIPASCSAVAADGTFIDSMAVSGQLCNSGINRSSGCGFSSTSTWSACGSKVLWVSPRTTKSNLVTVDGNSTSFNAGTVCNSTGCH